MFISQGVEHPSFVAFASDGPILTENEPSQLSYHEDPEGIDALHASLLEQMYTKEDIGRYAMLQMRTTIHAVRILRQKGSVGVITLERLTEEAILTEQPWSADDNDLQTASTGYYARVCSILTGVASDFLESELELDQVICDSIQAIHHTLRRRRTWHCPGQDLTWAEFARLHSDNNPDLQWDSDE